MEKVRKASDYDCTKCEVQGITKKADVFVGLNDIDAEHISPLCNKCAKDWRLELLILMCEQDEQE